MKHIRTLLVLHIVLFFYSLTGILSKSAAAQPFASGPFIALYGGMLVVLFVYALAWQQIIKRMPLTVAYANRAIDVVWGLLWGFFFFHESVTPHMLVGAALVIVGIVLFSIDDARSLGDTHDS